MNHQERINMVGGGRPFRDAERQSNLRQIKIRWNCRVDSLQCIYADGSSSEKHGGDGGRDEIFALDLDEAIITVWIWAGDEIDAIQFQTTKGRLSPKYGGDGGYPTIFRGHDGTRERALMGFEGRSTWIVSSLKPMWSDTRDLDSEHVVVGDAQGGDGGSASVRTPPSSGNNSAADTNMSPLCPQGRSGSHVDRLAPVWSPDPPINYALRIDSFGEINSDISGNPETARTSYQSVINTTMDNMLSRVVWTIQASKSSTITLSDSSRAKIGGKVVFEVTAKGTLGIPYVVEGETSTKFGIEVSGEKEWGNTAMDGQTVSRTYTETTEQTVTVRPHMQLQGKLVVHNMVIQDLKWEGEVTVTYAGGRKRTIPVDGTFDSASATKCNTSYVTIDMEEAVVVEAST